MLIKSSGLSKVKDSIKQTIFFGHEPNAELIAIITVYFVQGIIWWMRLGLTFFLKDELHLGPSEVSALFGLVFLPWILKPLYGFISDGVPIFGYRRRPYLIISGILGAIAWMSLATIVHSSWAATAAIALSCFSMGVSDVIVDSVVVELAKGESQAAAGSLQSLTWAASGLGGMLTAYLTGVLLEHISTRTLFSIIALFPLLVSAVAWLIVESPVNQEGQDHQNLLKIKYQLGQLRKVFSQKSIWLPTAFIFIWQASPKAESAYFYFLTNELHFQPEFLGRVNLLTSIASLLGVLIFQRFLKSVPFRVIFGWSTVLSATLGMSLLLLVTHTNRVLGIEDHWFSLGDSLILSIMGKIAFMPVLVLAARLCPEGVEATFFALLMSVHNLAGVVSHEMGAILTYWLGVTETNFEYLWLLIMITSLSTLLPLPFLNWLPAAEEDTEISALQTASANNGEQPFLNNLISEVEPATQIKGS